MRKRHRLTLERLAYGQDDIDSDSKVLSAATNPDYISKLQGKREEILAGIRNAEKETAI
jgi:hypothetical protein